MSDDFAIAMDKDERCLRGLRYWFRVEQSYSVEQLIVELQRVFFGQLLCFDERWGDTHIRILILQFRFELRIGGSGNDVELNHRMTPSLRQQAQDREAVRAGLARVLGGRVHA